MAYQRRTAPSAALVGILVVVAWTMLLVVDTTAISSSSVSQFGFVEAVLDAETGGDCVDSDPVNCPFWAATGECQSNRSYMHTHCKKSCDRCNVVRVNDRNEINRYIEERKQELEAKRELRRKEKEAMEALQGGLENGDDTAQQKLPPPQQQQQQQQQAAQATTTTSQATVSSDGSIVIDEVPKQQTNSRVEVVSNTKPTVTQTTTTSSSSSSSSSTTGVEKKKVKIDSNTGLECVDLNENCPFWASQGECRNNRKYMINNCRLSCDRCHIIRANSANDIHRFISSKQKETERVLRQKRQARNVQKILQGEM